MKQRQFNRPREIGRRGACVGLAAGVATALGGLLVCSRGLAQEEKAILSLADFGVTPKATPQQNLDRFNKAIANAPPGAILRLPPAGDLPCLVDTSGGWQAAIQVGKPLTLQIDGDLKATHSAVRHNAPFILNITSPGVTLTGTGRIIGNGATDDSNTGTDETLPGLIRVAADDFTMTGVEVVTPPKVGVLLYQCQRATIDRARFSGGPKTYGDTGHFAVRAAGGGRHVFSNNRFYPASDGGMCVQCIMLVTSDDNLIADNHATHPYEKLVYGFGNRNIARNNTVIGNPGFVPGTNIQGTITAVFRFHGSFNRVERNKTFNCAGGAQMMDGSAHVVIENQFLDCGQSAISAYQSNLTNSTFRNNIGTRGKLIGFLAGDGMRLISDRGAARAVVVEGNDIAGFSVADPVATMEIWRARRSFGRNSIVKPSVGNGRYYIALGDGTSDRREPNWPSAPNAIVTDGTLRWVTMPFEGGQAEIKLAGRGPTSPISDSRIQNNRTSGGRYGVVTQFVTRSVIKDNRLDASEWAQVEDNGANNSWQSNTVSGTLNRGVRTLSRSSSFRE